MTPEVKDKDVSVRLANKEREIKSLISYLVGIEMGRYSLDVEGLAYAGGPWQSNKYVTYQPDSDGIIPLYPEVHVSNGLVQRLVGLIKHIYGEDTYNENINFIASVLNPKNGENPEETLDRYLNDGFYANHLKIYQKRPIYWMFSSGKKGGFKCLIYMHRYTPNTLAEISSKYLNVELSRLENMCEKLDMLILNADENERKKLKKEKQLYHERLDEARNYAIVLDSMANKYIAIDLDDGVKVNYQKFQNIEVMDISGRKVHMNLLEPIK